MLKKSDIFPEDFNYKSYIEEYKFIEILNLKDSPNKKILDTDSSIVSSVDPNNKNPFPAKFDDLCRLHYITLNRKVTTVLEFGVGKSTLIFCEALFINKKKHLNYSLNNLRRGNLYQCYSIDNYEYWINKCKENISEKINKENISHFHLCDLIMSEFNGRVCTFYNPLPNLCPDLIYLDGPDQFSPIGDVRGITTKHQDRMPMSADLLSIEHFLQPGTLIIVDGRTANARFLKKNLQRDWAYFYSEEWDQHFFELQEKPLGKFNKLMINHCLGEDFYKRI